MVHERALVIEIYCNRVNSIQLHCALNGWIDRIVWQNGLQLLLFSHREFLIKKSKLRLLKIQKRYELTVLGLWHYRNLNSY